MAEMSSRTGTNNGGIKGQELLKYKSVKNWIVSLEQSADSRGKPFTTMARRQRFGRLLEYTTFTGLNPDQLLAEGTRDINLAGERLNEFFQGKTKSGIEWNTACTNISFLRGFYTHNDLHFPKKFRLPKRQVSAVSKRDSKTEIYGYDEQTDKVIFNNGTLQHFIQNLNFRDQTIALCLLSTGADATDLLKLKISFVKDDKGKVSNVKRFLWHDNRAKDGIEFKVYFSEEATQFLKRYVEQERANAGDSEPLFVQEPRRYKRKNPKTKEPEEITVGEQMQAHLLAMNFRQAATKMGYAVDEESNPFRPKRFRHLFRTACSNASVDSGFIMAFMGHASNVSADYLEKSAGLFLKEYVKVEPYLTVFGVDKHAVTELGEELNSLAQRQTEMEKTNEALTKQVEALTDQVHSLSLALLQRIPSKEVREATEKAQEKLKDKGLVLDE